MSRPDSPLVAAGLCLIAAGLLLRALIPNAEKGGADFFMEALMGAGIALEAVALWLNAPPPLLEGEGMTSFALLLVLQAASLPPAPLDEQTAPRTIEQPHWVRLPNGDDIARNYPMRAHQRDGAATMRCEVTTKGTLTDCAIVSEVPAGFDFGAATISLAPKFRMDPPPASAGATVTIPIRWVSP